MMHSLLLIAACLAGPVDDYCSRLEAFGFSGTVLVARDGKIVLHKGYGLANRERGLRNTKNTRFDIASTTKQFTAAAILRLEMQGKLSTDDLLSKHIPGVPDDMKTVTIHHLLTHTSGIPRFPVARQGPAPRFMGSKLNAAPGAKFQYSNSNYLILADVIRRASGGSYRDYLRRHLFKPAGMTDTGFCGDEATDAVAHGYESTGDTGPVTGNYGGSPGYIGAGGIVTTALDLYRWDRALRGDAVLSAAARRKLVTPALMDYACGWWVRRTKRGTTLVEHGGVVVGSETEFRRLIEEDAVVIVLANMRGSAKLLAFHVERLLLGAKVPPPPRVLTVAPAALAKHAGIYRDPEGGTLTVSATEGGLLVGATGQRAVDLLYRSRVEDPQRFAEQEKAAAKVLAAWIAGDADAIRGLMIDAIPRDWPDRYLRDHWAPAVAGKGAFESLEPLGSKMKGFGLVEVTHLLRFEKGKMIVQLGMRGRKLNLIHLDSTRFPFERRYRPVAEDRFVHFQLVGYRTREIRFEKDGVLVLHGTRFKR